MIAKAGTFFGKPCILVCDANCAKAWGINNRPEIQLSDDEDDHVWLADHELGEAPVDPGTAEGDETKPTRPEDRLNKWCARECERGQVVEPNEAFNLIDFNQRYYNYEPHYRPDENL